MDRVNQSFSIDSTLVLARAGKIAFVPCCGLIVNFSSLPPMCVRSALLIAKGCLPNIGVAFGQTARCSPARQWAGMPLFFLIKTRSLNTEILEHLNPGEPFDRSPRTPIAR